MKRSKWVTCFSCQWDLLVVSDVLFYYLIIVILVVYLCTASFAPYKTQVCSYGSTSICIKK